MLILVLLLPGFACKKMDSTYKEFIVPGGLVYPGKAYQAVAYTGRYRAQVEWLRGADPLVTKARIFWNNFADSAEINTPQGIDTFRYVVNNLQESAYTFYVRTYNAKGDISVPVELVTKVYGDKYQSGLLTRPVLSAGFDDADTLKINWGGADITNGAWATEVTYTDSTDQQKTARFSTTEAVAKILDAKKGTAYSYRTLYLPDTRSIDTFYTETIAAPNIPYKFSKQAWVATTDSYAETSQLSAGGGPPDRAIDNDVNTFWHTDHTTTKPAYPHWLAVDMKKSQTVTDVELTCRPNVTNSFTEFYIEGSNDGVTWKRYTSALTLIQQNATQRYAIPGNPSLRYIRIWATKGASYYASIAEFSVLGF